ncbi:bcl-2-like protein 1 [Echeneis naucrates]|uniref:Bcl-2-like protein 1 n=1 Tax=Echeneis naucrates TaxID=173247 RepID=A0A665VSD7_ECHNA|nr:bcl-2-like protein 1 [Echeneis naucrates]XP_029358362.1 bcl-2-like protein 1 [Echeneis naucrates]
MSYSNRELVEFFIHSKLPLASLLRPEDAGGQTEGDKANSAARNGLPVISGSMLSYTRTPPPPPCDIEAVKEALRDSTDEFEFLFRQAFSDLSSQLDITSDTVYQSFETVMDEVFKDGINWGRIVALFAFGGELCVECVEKNMSEMVPSIAEWMTIYLDLHIRPWIETQGGWDCFAEIFGQNSAATARRSQEAARRWLLVGVALLTGVLMGVLIAKKQ